MPTFTTLVLADRDYGSPLTEDEVDGLYNRDEDLRERPVYLEMAEAQETGTSYVQKKAWQIYIPQSAVQLFVAFQYRTQDVTTGEVECRIGGLTSTEISDAKVNYSTSPVVEWCNFTDLSTVVSTEVTLTLWSKTTTPTGGTPWIRVREADGPVSYFTA